MDDIAGYRFPFHLGKDVHKITFLPKIAHKVIACTYRDNPQFRFRKALCTVDCFMEAAIPAADIKTHFFSGFAGFSDKPFCIARRAAWVEMATQEA